MSQDQDFDFKTKLGHYRGHGRLGLAAFVIDRAAVVTIMLIGLVAGTPSLPRLWHALFGR
jgi:hypothetical protein